MGIPKKVIWDLQQWLKNHGAELTIDGLPGSETRNAIFNTFRNRDALTATPIEKAVVAARLGGTPAQLNAVSAVEAPHGGWDNTGLLKCLYERHYGWRRWKVKIPLLSDPKPGGYTVDIDHDRINDSWEKVADAALKFGAEAFECASWGKFQIMGAHWKKLGYQSVLDFVWKLSRSELVHYEALARYIDAFGLRKAFQSISNNPDDNIPFAEGYNGKGFRKYAYHERIAEEMP